MELRGSLEVVGYQNQGVVLMGLIADRELLPVDVAAGSEFLAVDTGQWFVFGEGTWYETEGEV